MPSKTGLQKNLRRYGLFLIIGLCITALIWGAMSAQLNTRALSFNEDAALVRLILDQPDGLHLQTGGSYWLIERRYTQWAQECMPDVFFIFSAPVYCLWEVAKSGAALISASL